MVILILQNTNFLTAEDFWPELDRISIYEEVEGCVTTGPLVGSRVTLPIDWLPVRSWFFDGRTNVVNQLEIRAEIHLISEYEPCHVQDR